MAVQVEDIYKMMFEHHKFVSEYRLSLIRTWGALYVALAGAFVWAQKNLCQFSWIFGALAILLTILMWCADVRHRPAIWACRKVAIDIEKSIPANIPEGLGYFSQLQEGFPCCGKKVFSHSLYIDIFAAISCLLLILGTIYLYFHY